MSLRTHKLGLEAIAVQKGDVLLLGLAGKIGALQGKKVNQSKVTKSGIGDLIQKTTNLNVTIKVVPQDYAAYVAIPKLDKNHPLLNDNHRYETGDDDAVHLMARSRDIIKGHVDLESGTVHGDFAKVPVTIYLGANLLEGSKFTNEEVAAVLSHEIGHVFSYFEQIHLGVSLNHAINATVQAMFSEKRKITKVELLDAYTDLRGVTFEDKEKLANSRSAEGVAAVLLQGEVHKSVSATGSNLYDSTGFEFLSDQFATRHGGGMHLVTALDKLQRLSGDPIYRNTASFYAIELMKTVGFLGAVVLGGPAAMLFGVALLASNPHDTDYDYPLDRANRIKRDIMETLKDKNLDGARRDTALEHVKVIDDITEKMSQRSTTLQLVWKVLSPTARRQLNQKEAQQVIEEVLNNDMFVSAAKFQSLGAK